MTIGPKPASAPARRPGGPPDNAAARASESASTGMGLGWAATSTMLSGLALFGGLGWLLDHWWNTRWATPLGVVLGLGLAVYAVVMRFGPSTAEPDTTGPQAHPANDDDES